jgi:NNP family nitrate/nitrite transporter-like MFS transporter
MIREVYGGFEGAPDPLKYAFYGPLVGSLIRVLMGAPSDRWGGSVFTQLSGLGLISGSLALILGGYLTPGSVAQFPVFVAIMLWIFFWSGVGNAATFRQFPIIFAHSPRQAGGVIGWTAAIAAYGPFAFSLLLGASMTRTGSAVPFFWGLVAFCVVASCINWWYYTRKGAEKFDWGTRGGTWWDRSQVGRSV